MRLRVDPRVRVLALVASVMLAGAASPGAANEHSRTRIIRAADIDAAVAKVRADPNLGTTRTIKTLRLKRRKASRRWEWLRWLQGLSRWFDQSSRLVVWLAVAGLALALAAYLVRRMYARSPGSTDEAAFVPPTHVQGLDVRPGSLPDDIGAAARTLWERGDRRAALALLYRGMVSRLVHVHQLPVRDSSTEGDCVTLVADRLPDRSAYVAHLVQVREAYVYGGHDVPSDTILGLCDRFALALDARATGDGHIAGGAA